MIFYHFVLLSPILFYTFVSNKIKYNTPKFEIYTYQFQRILKCTQTEIDFEGIPKSVCTDEQWNDRQKLFGKLFKPGVKLEFKSGRSPLIYEVLYDANSIIVLRIANEKVKFISGADFKPKSVKDYPWCYVVFDNRDGIQHNETSARQTRKKEPKE